MPQAGNLWKPAECPVLVALVALKSIFTAACSEMFRVLQDAVWKDKCWTCLKETSEMLEMFLWLQTTQSGPWLQTSNYSECRGCFRFNIQGPCKRKRSSESASAKHWRIMVCLEKQDAAHYPLSRVSLAVISGKLWPKPSFFWPPPQTDRSSFQLFEIFESDNSDNIATGVDTSHTCTFCSQFSSTVPR